MSQVGCWKVGRLLAPSDDDTEFEEWQAAVDRAVEKSTNREVMAVWLMPDRVLDVLVFDGKVFKE